MPAILIIPILLAAALIVAIKFSHRETKDRLDSLLKVNQPGDEDKQTYALLHANLSASSQQTKWALMVIGVGVVCLITFALGKTLTSLLSSVPVAAIGSLLIITAYIFLSKVIQNPTVGLPKPATFGNDKAASTAESGAGD